MLSESELPIARRLLDAAKRISRWLNTSLTGADQPLAELRPLRSARDQCRGGDNQFSEYSNFEFVQAISNDLILSRASRKCRRTLTALLSDCPAYKRFDKVRLGLSLLLSFGCQWLFSIGKSLK